MRSRTISVNNKNRNDEQAISTHHAVEKMNDRMREFLNREKELYEEMIFTDEYKNLKHEQEKYAIKSKFGIFDLSI